MGNGCTNLYGAATTPTDEVKRHCWLAVRRKEKHGKGHGRLAFLQGELAHVLPSYRCTQRLSVQC